MLRARTNTKYCYLSMVDHLDENSFSSYTYVYAEQLFCEKYLLLIVNEFTLLSYSVSTNRKTFVSLYASNYTNNLYHMIQLCASNSIERFS